MKNLILFVIAGVIVYILMMQHARNHPIMNKGEKLTRKAIQKGYVAQAHLIDNQNIRQAQYVGNRLDTNRKSYLWVCRATYQYEVEGRAYTVTQNLMNYPNQEVTVYYPSGDPARAYLKGCEPGSFIPKGHAALFFGGTLVLYLVLRCIF